MARSSRPRSMRESRSSRPFRHARPLLALAVVGGARRGRLHAARPGDRARRSREAFVGVEEAKPQLFSAAARRGRLLVESDAGPWVVSADGSQAAARRATAKRRGRRSARFVVAARGNELAALERDGDSALEARAAGRARSRAGAGSAHRHADRVPQRRPSPHRRRRRNGRRRTRRRCRRRLESRPRGARARATCSPTSTTARTRRTSYDDAGSVLWRSAPFPKPRLLAWSSDGGRLAARRPRTRSLVVRRDERAPARCPLPARRHRRGLRSAASHDLALVRARRGRSCSTRTVRAARPQRVFAGAGVVRRRRLVAGPALAPRRLARGRPVGVRSRRRQAQDRGGLARLGPVRVASFPRIAGWCCAPAR